ncbi:type IV toxin-antitoxin system AbiEi family antitoxin domain-containing protein [Kitasatospora sp. NPDC049285]|uniref:type IV toxin-antitoxin system AbiEi family antitoxin domain-containing protein n=1 Tax=Kitasatospora sp. NPDC049285 TaxID=3157096 RepID=UPI00342E2895
MNYQIPPQPASLEELARRQQNVVTASQLRARGVPARMVSEHCRSGGPWQRLLPRVYLLQDGSPTPEQRMWAALLYAAQNGREEGGREGAVITGAAALALYGFVSMPRLPAVLGVEVLVPRQRRLRDSGPVRIRRTERELVARSVHGLACAPVARAVADAIREWTEQGAFETGLVGPGLLRAVLREAVEREGGCAAAELIGELADAGLLEEPRVRAAVDELLAARRESAFAKLAGLAAEQGLPAPLAGPELRMRGGTYIAVPDLYWPEAAVAVEVDSELRCVSEGEAAWVRGGQHRMEYLGVRVVYVSSARLAAERDVVGGELAEAYERGGEDVVELVVTER